jgi:N-acetylmuramoyl-L-alanine amidase
MRAVSDPEVPLQIERRSTPNFDRGRNGHPPRAIVVHTNVGTFAGTLGWFALSESGVSAHYLVGLDGRVVQFVGESDAARHAGRVLRPTATLVRGDRASPNLYTIGIEFEDGGNPLGVGRTDEQYRAGAMLIRQVAARWQIPLNRTHVIGHREIFAAKDCPGNLDIERLIDEARR